MSTTAMNRDRVVLDWRTEGHPAPGTWVLAHVRGGTGPHGEERYIAGIFATGLTRHHMVDLSDPGVAHDWHGSVLRWAPLPELPERMGLRAAKEQSA
jgi:hypothetical protein